MRRGKDRARMAALAMILLAAGCATPLVREERVESLGARAMPASHPRAPGLAADEKALLQGRRLDWGLALSGGGLRSALFSLGVLKALYDSGKLQQVDIVSTVSGGGYTAYWLFANELAAGPGGRFGAYSLADAPFPKRVCELITKSNFVTYGRLGGVLRGPLRPRAAKLYETSLLRSFGAADRISPPIRIADLEEPVRRREMPYLVMNATIDSPAAAQSWPHKLIEFTPILYGSGDFGYRRWAEAPDPRSLPMRRIASVSGAAFAPLKQRVDVQDPASGKPPVTLWDGGQSENLGAFALIMRGVGNIIISDAEHDPAYRFPAYRKLKNNLALYGLKLVIKDIDEHLAAKGRPPYARAVAHGRVIDKAGWPVASIHYVKASLAKEIEPLLAAQRGRGTEGQRAQRDYLTALRATADRAEGAWICDDLASTPLPLASWAAYNVVSYSDYLNERNLKVKLMNAAGDLLWRGLKIGFPQYSTGDQSFYIDQALAFVGLGYLEASRLGTAWDPPERPGR